MASQISLSTGLKNYLLDGGHFKNAFEAASGSGLIYVYEGPVPVDADAALTGHTLLCIIGSENPPPAGGVVPATGLTLGTSGSGAIAKTNPQTWIGSIPAAGVGQGATYFRYVVRGEDPTTLSTSLRRFQGLVDTQGADLNFNPNTFTSGNTKSVNVFEIRVGA